MVYKTLNHTNSMNDFIGILSPIARISIVFLFFSFLFFSYCTFVHSHFHFYTLRFGSVTCTMCSGIVWSGLEYGSVGTGLSWSDVDRFPFSIDIYIYIPIESYNRTIWLYKYKSVQVYDSIIIIKKEKCYTQACCLVPFFFCLRGKDTTSFRLPKKCTKPKQ